MVGAVVLGLVRRGAEAAGGAQLLQAGLPVQAGAAGGRLDQQRVEQPVHEGGRRLQAQAEVDRTDQRLERVGEDRLLLPAAGGLLAAAQQQLRAEAAVAEPAGDAGQRGHVDHGGAQLGQLPLGQVGLAAVERVGDDEAEHRVAEELQALVGGQAAVLVRLGAVGERQREQPVGQRQAQGVLQPRRRPAAVLLPRR